MSLSSSISRSTWVVARVGMRILNLALALLVSSALFSPALAQQPPGRGRTVLWTTVGTGAGFGIGLFAGLTAFDDAINSDRKVWTSAIIGAAAGGTVAYLLTRGRRNASPSQVVSSVSRPGPIRLDILPFNDADVRALAASTRLRR